MNIIKLILIGLAVVAFAWWFIRKAKQVRENKARVKLAHMRWLLEKADECELKDDDETKTWPGPEAMA